MLLVVTLFSIGFIEHNYEWARLPLSSYLKPDANKNTVSIAPIQLPSNITPVEIVTIPEVNGEIDIADKELVPIKPSELESTPEQSNE